MNEFISWQGFLALVLGGLYGSLFGAIPGLTATLAVALFIPIAFFLDPLLALPAIIAISSVAIFAGDVGAVVARIPGTPASAAYAEELYDLSRSRGPVYSLGLCAMGSAVGGVVGTVVLVFSATGIAAVARLFSSFEYFWIAVLGLTAGVFASGGAPIKGLASLLLGVLFSTVGIDPTLGYPRFDFGSPDLLSGLNYIVAMIGLFGFSDVLDQIQTGRRAEPVALESGVDAPTRGFFRLPIRLIARHRVLTLRSSLVGVAVGFLPGAGADIGSWVSSSIEKLIGRKSGRPPHDRVVLAGTTANNAAVAGAWIPALSLGLPGDTVTAIVLGVFLMKGITPGPLLFQNDPGLVWALYATFLLSNILLLPVYGYLTARLASRLIRVPRELLMTLVAGLCIVGSYSINNSAFDVWVMAAMGLLAFLLRRGGFPLAQIVLGMVLGPILEQHFMVSAIKSRWDMTAFFSRPMAIGLMLATLAILFAGIRMSGFFGGSPEAQPAGEISKTGVSEEGAFGP